MKYLTGFVVRVFFFSEKAMINLQKVKQGAFLRNCPLKPHDVPNRNIHSRLPRAAMACVYEATDTKVYPLVFVAFFTL